MNTSGYTDHATISQIRYAKPVFDSDGAIEFTPNGFWTPTIDADNPAYNSLFKPFNLNQYLYPRPPIDMGLIEVGEAEFNVLRMPLKFPNTPYRIPKQLAKLEPLIRRVTEYEAFINKQHGECFCHITYDMSTVDAGTYHRYPGYHGDGIQGTRLTPKINVEHSYIVTTAPPTQFCIQPFFLKHLDEAKHNYFLEFDKQAMETNVYGSLPNHLYLIDPYMVHRTPKIHTSVRRLFLRITYAFSELQHPKNTINPLFEGQQYEKRADIREHLVKNEFDVPYHLYGLQR